MPKPQIKSTHRPKVNDVIKASVHVYGFSEDDIKRLKKVAEGSGSDDMNKLTEVAEGLGSMNITKDGAKKDDQKGNGSGNK